jgi:hypothetical protein
MIKLCKTCNKEKPINEFPIHSVKGDKIYYRTNCKDCDQKYRADYRKNNLELKKYHKIYKKDYYLNNKEELLLYQRNYLREVRKSKPTRKIRENISRSIRYHLSKNNYSKDSKSMLPYLPYSLDELKEHLEKLFEWWMTWDNWGSYNKERWNDNDPSTWTWQIDHIIPHSKFSYTSMDDEDFKKCWALDNLRPFRSKDNILDGLIKTRHGIER